VVIIFFNISYFNIANTKLFSPAVVFSIIRRQRPYVPFGIKIAELIMRNKKYILFFCQAKLKEKYNI